VNVENMITNVAYPVNTSLFEGLLNRGL